METLDRVFEVLSEERRRYALYYLEQADGPVPVEDLLEQIAAWETNGSPATVPDEKFNEIGLEFYHVDLPKTSDLEYVQYDPESGEVELTGAPPRFNAIISIARVIEQPGQNS